MANPREDYTSGISIDALEPLAAVIYAASENDDTDFMRMVGSTVLNRLESGREEFGAHNGRISEVINNPRSPYYEKNSKLYDQFSKRAFKTEAEKQRAKQATAMASALVRGTVERVPGEFWFNKKELENFKKNPGLFYLDRVEQVGEYKTKQTGTDFFTFAYPKSSGKQTARTKQPNALAEYGFDNVRDFQQFLRDNGQDPGAIDGIYGDKTHKAYLSLKQKSAGKR